MSRALTYLIRKLYLGSFVYSLLVKYLKKEPMRYMDERDALSFLTRFSPDSHGTCINSHNFKKADCDLEIIVPCYNVEKFVHQTIDSILLQETKYSFHLTLVNDESKDNTLQILNSYSKYDNVTIINQKNMGLSGARNTGIKQAHGKYIMFMDSDDLMMPDTIEALMNAAVENNLDIVDSGHIRFMEDEDKYVSVFSSLKVHLYNLIQRKQMMPLINGKRSLFGFAWGKVYRREVFKNVEYPLGYWNQDTLTWMILEPLAKRIGVLDMISTKYRMNPASISHKPGNNKKRLDTLYVTLQLLSDAEKLGVPMNQEYYEKLLAQVRMNTIRTMFLDREVQEAIFSVHVDMINNKFKDFQSKTDSGKCIEYYMINHDIDGLLLWCKWH